MAKTALSIAHDAAVIAGLRPPSTIGGESDRTGRICRVLMNTGGRRLQLKRGPFGESWPELVRQFELTTQAGVDIYPLPDDFAESINDTAWDNAQHRTAIGPIDVITWAALKGWQATLSSISVRYRVESDDLGRKRMRLDPVPQAEQGLTLFYIGRNWVKTAEASPISAQNIERDTDIPVFEETLLHLDLLWRLKKSRGLQDWVADEAEFELHRDTLFAQEISPRELDISGGSMVDTYGYGDTYAASRPSFSISQE